MAKGKRKTYTEKANEVFVQFRKRNLTEVESTIIDKVFAGLPIEASDLSVFNDVARADQTHRAEVEARVAALDAERERLLSDL